MPEDASAVATQPSAAVEQPAVSTAPGVPAQPEAQQGASLSEVAARLADLEKALHTERTARGRAEAKVRIAAGEKVDAFTEAFAGFEETKAALMAQGYDEDAIDTLAEHNPAALKKLARNMPPVAPAQAAKTPAGPGLTPESMAALKAAGWTPPGEAATPQKRMGAAAEPMVGNMGGAPAVISDDDMDKAHLERRITDDQYRRFLNRR